MIFLQDAYQARLEEVTSQAESTPGSQAPDVAQKMQLWREVSGGVSRGRCYGTADLSVNIRENAPTLTQHSSAPSQSSRSAASSADACAARAEQEAVRAREDAARAEERAARAEQQAARANQRLDEILARLNQPPPAPPAPRPRPSAHGDADYNNEYDPNFTLLDSDDTVFH